MSGDIVAIVPARGGSKGIARKNLVELGGCPLIAWTVRAARNSPHVSRIIVSTDDADIAAAAAEEGAEWPFPRPEELARDETPMLAVARHVVERAQLRPEDRLLLLQPTSPFRSAEDISCAVRRLEESGASSVVSVVRAKMHPLWAMRFADSGRLVPFIDQPEMKDRRQDLPVAYFPNGAIYLTRVSRILEGRSWYGEDTVAFEMPSERSLDIDDAWDLKLARALVASGASEGSSLR